MNKNQCPNLEEYFETERQIAIVLKGVQTMELTDMIRNHKTKYNGNWDKLKCTRCGKDFFIGADMCDAELIQKELKRIDKIPCVEKPQEKNDKEKTKRRESKSKRKQRQ